MHESIFSDIPILGTFYKVRMEKRTPYVELMSICDPVSEREWLERFLQTLMWESFTRNFWVIPISSHIDP
jgi:hypothetical protein